MEKERERERERERESWREEKEEKEEVKGARGVFRMGFWKRLEPPARSRRSWWRWWRWWVGFSVHGMDGNGKGFWAELAVSGGKEEGRVEGGGTRPTLRS